MKEITWSLMHPTHLDAEYMREVIAWADRSPVRVDSFEICARCHSPLGGLDGLVRYEEYPEVQLDRAAVEENIRVFNRILDLAHASGRKVYYWHREVVAFPGLTEVFSPLLDEKGEFNLLGEAFEKLLRYKITKALESAPALDGLVLTLTEADYSAIHNSTPETYPPAEVVRKVAGIFYEELSARGKRFILRSFGSVAKDYEDILQGAALCARSGMHFEVETKITPYDFDPFLPENPFLLHTENLTLGAECDCLGEFLGAGNLPAENVENIVKWVRAAQKAQVDRFAIRLDRVGNNVFAKYPLNLYAYMRAIEAPSVTAGQIRSEYAEKNIPSSCRSVMEKLSFKGLEAILKTNYIHGNLIYHQNPPAVSLRLFKGGGFFAHFTENVPLKYLSGIWAILKENSTGTREELLAEKDQALSLAEEGLAELESIRSALSPAEYERLRDQWSNLLCAAACTGAFCHCTSAYFEDMALRREQPVALRKALEEADRCFETWVPGISSDKESVRNVGDRTFDIRKDIRNVYPIPLYGICHLLEEEYEAERAARNDLRYKEALDLLIPGSLSDEWRCGRYMHGCDAVLEGKRPCRIVGNKIFPNGKLLLALRGKGAKRLLLHGEGALRWEAQGWESQCDLHGITVLDLPEHLQDQEMLEISFAKNGKGEFPRLYAAGVLS
ncbi:MAG: hypothetical protein J6S58_06295 [Lentisphaeria bacterium]|nr:hypothetical protein [Lentisphaeria bacterium]